MAEHDGQKEGGPQPDFQKEMDAFVEGMAGLFGSLKEVFVKSKDEVVRGARLGKVRIDTFQLRKDREHFLQRLGEEVYDLMLRGDLKNESLEKPFLKIRALDEKIAEHDSEITRLMEEQQAAGVGGEVGVPGAGAEAQASAAEAPPETAAAPELAGAKEDAASAEEPAGEKKGAGKGGKGKAPKKKL
jgi:hypothetical protein